MLKNLIYIFIGGGVGSIMRYLVSHYTHKLWTINVFPLGTFLVNILGCFAIGVLSSYFIKENNDFKFLLITGFCGGFTTFSTFSAENVALWQSENYINLSFYVIFSLILGFLAVWLGSILIKS